MPRRIVLRGLQHAGCLLLILVGGISCDTSWLMGEDRIVTAPFPTTRLARDLTSSQRAIRLLAIERIVREYADHPEAVKFITDSIVRMEKRESGQEVTLRLIRSLLKFADPQLTDVAIGLLSAQDHRVAMTALDLLVQRNESRALPHILALAARDEFNAQYGFRTAVIQAVISFREVESVKFLVHQLERLDGQNEATVRKYLSRIARLPETSEVEAWNRWWEGLNKSELRFDDLYMHNVEGSEQSTSNGPRFFGLDVRAKRVVFVFDRSGSMNDPLLFNQFTVPDDPDATETRLARAQGELISVLQKLPPDTHFGIIVFNDRIRAWQPGLLPASHANKARAIAFVESIRAAGDTAWYDAIEAALRLDGNTEALFFLTDGMPTTGKFVAAPDIVDAVADENFFRRATLNTIGLGVPHRAKRFLRILASEHEGQFRSLGNRVEPLAKPRLGNVNAFTPRVAFTPPMPPINRIKAFSAAVAARRLKLNELVLGVEHLGAARAYPINMLTGPNREIINDKLGGERIAVTWCHLSHYGMAYRPSVGGRDLTFAVSGLLWNDNLVMFDTATRSVWSQIYGKAMAGPQKGMTLQRLSSTMTDWATWRQLHPKTTVMLLSRTAHVYDREIYRYSSDYFLGTTDGKLTRAWPLDILLLERAVNDRLGDRPVLATIDVVSMTPFLYDRQVGDTVYSFYLKDGRVVDQQTRSSWDIRTGQAVAGPLKGKRLTAVHATLALRDIWLTFYPNGTVFGDQH